MNLYMYTALEHAQITPMEQIVYVKWNLLSLWPTDASFKEISFELWFYTYFFS